MAGNFILCIIVLGNVALFVESACTTYSTSGTAVPGGCTIVAGATAADTKIYTTSNSVDYSCAHKNSWLVNTVSDVSPHLSTGVTSSSYPTTANMGPCISTDVTSTSTTTVTSSITTLPSSRPTTDYGAQYFTWSGKGLPKYSYTMTEAQLTTLNNRPNKEYDFTCGETTAVVGQTYQFGESIGYGCGDSCICVKSSDYSVASDSSTCSTGSNHITICPTLGWLPPGPGCPTAQTYTNLKFPLNPLPEGSSAGCYMSMGPVGYFVNGIPFFAPSDGFSYQSEGYWMQSAIGFESYDVDVCNGHPAGGQYHHHCWSPCLATRLNDAGTGHSPIYGFAADGFPFYGPYQASGVLATSCFKTRDYTGAGTAAGGWGCSSATGERTCQLNSVLNPVSTTTLSSDKYGPSTSTKVNTQSGNTITAVSGVFYEDYYFDSTCYLGLGTSADGTLDVHNGHDHDGLGYHYHLTIDSNLTPTFPYGPGPQFFGCVSNNYCMSTFGGKVSTTSSCANTGSEAWNFGKLSYSLTSGTASCTPTSPTMAPTVAAQSTCSVDSTETYSSASDCPGSSSSSSTSIGLVIGLAVGLGAPFLAAVSCFLYNKNLFAFNKGVSGGKVLPSKNVELL